MNQLRVLVVEDEELARRRLRRLLTASPDVEIVGEAGTGAEAVSAIRSARPDVVLLDVKLAGADGFGVLRELERGGHQRPLVIFVTAFEEHAVEAFEVCALDYVLKPIVPARLADALARAREWLDRSETSLRHARLTEDLAALVKQHLRAERAGVRGYRERVVVRAGETERFVDLADVCWIEGAGNYVRLHASSGPFLVRSTLYQLERELDPDRFVRIHRSALVNLAHVRRLHRPRGGQWMVELVGGAQVPLAKSRRRSFRLRTGR